MKKGFFAFIPAIIILIIITTLISIPFIFNKKTGEVPKYDEYCQDERPEFCTKEYNPVCAQNGETYSNPCVACSDSNVIGYNFGECESETFYCSDEMRSAEFCTEEYNPVCGYFTKEVNCIRAPCADTYSNPCYACQNSMVSYYRFGECE